MKHARQSSYACIEENTRRALSQSRSFPSSLLLVRAKIKPLRLFQTLDEVLYASKRVRTVIQHIDAHSRSSVLPMDALEP